MLTIPFRTHIDDFKSKKIREKRVPNNYNEEDKAFQKFKINHETQLKIDKKITY